MGFETICYCWFTAREDCVCWLMEIDLLVEEIK